MFQEEAILQFITDELHAIQLPHTSYKANITTYASPANGKPFAHLQVTPYAALGMKKGGYVEMLTLRCNPLLSGSLRLQDEFFSPVGIRSKRDEWITVILNGSIENNMLFSLLEMALSLVSENSPCEMTHRDWLIPANPKYFDLFKAFQENEIIFWKQSSKVSVGDIVYLYVAAPYSAIMFRCRAVEVNIPRVNHRRNSTHAMRIELLHTYEQSDFPLSKLKEYQITTVRGPRGIPRELKNELERTANTDINSIKKIHR